MKEFISTIDVNLDGTLDVEESMVYSFHKDSFSFVYRDVRAPSQGFIEFKEALLNEKSLPLGNEKGTISIEKSDHLKTKVRFEKITNQDIKFTLKYKVFNALKQNNKKAVLLWTPIPENYDFLIKSGEVTVNFPKNIPPFDIVNYLQKVKNVSYLEDENSLICSFTNLNNKSFEIKSDLPLESMKLIDYPSPNIQPSLYETYPHLIPYGNLYIFLTALLILFLIIVIIILIRRYNLQIKNLPQITDLPSHKHPALVARLLQVGSDDLNLIPVLMHMAIKKLISFTQVTNKNGKPVKDYYIDIAKDVNLADDLDLGYLELLKKEEQRKNKRIELKTLVANSYRYKKELLKIINDKFDQTGFVDVLKKKRYFKRLIFFFVVLMIGVATSITGALFFNKGVALAPLPAFIVLGYWIYMMLYLDDKSILSPEGLNKWNEWKAFKNYIAKALKDKNNDLNPNDAETIFPYILLMGYGQQYLRYFNKKKINLNFPNLGAIADDMESLNTLITIVVISTAANNASIGASGGGGGGGAGAG